MTAGKGSAPETLSRELPQRTPVLHDSGLYDLQLSAPEATRMKKKHFIIAFIVALAAVATPSRAADTLRCIGDYHNRGPDQGFYWYYVEMRMNGSTVESLSWETSYASDQVPRGRACRIDTTGFEQSRLQDATIVLRDPVSSCTVSLTPKKKEQGALLLDASGCLEQFCTENGVLIPITVTLAKKKCLPVTKK